MGYDDASTYKKMKSKHACFNFLVACILFLEIVATFLHWIIIQPIWAHFTFHFCPIQSYLRSLCCWALFLVKLIWLSFVLHWMILCRWFMWKCGNWKHLGELQLFGLQSYIFFAWYAVLLHIILVEALYFGFKLFVEVMCGSIFVSNLTFVYKVR